jgi:hypothetical protein
VLVAIYANDAEADGAVKGKVTSGGRLSLAEMGLRDHEARILEFIVRNKCPLFRGSIRNVTRGVTFFNVVGHGNSFPFVNPVFRRVISVAAAWPEGPRATLPCGDLNLINKTRWHKVDLITFRDSEDLGAHAMKQRYVRLMNHERKFVVRQSISAVLRFRGVLPCD